MTSKSARKDRGVGGPTFGVMEFRKSFLLVAGAFVALSWLMGWPSVVLAQAGGEVVMKPYDQSEHRELAVTLHRAEVANAYGAKWRSFYTAEKVGLMVGTFDINDDGTDEIFLMKTLWGSCGSIGCPTEVYQLQDGRWVSIASMAGFAIYVGDKKDADKGYRVLGGDLIYHRWNGTEYRDFCWEPDDIEKCPEG